MQRLFRNMTLLLTFLLSGAGGGGLALAASGQLSADVGFGAAAYSAEVDGIESEESSHLYQQYTVRYRHQNTLFKGRAGSYTLLIGFEHTVLDPSLTRYGFDDPVANASMTRDKLYYQGRMTLAPGGLPFRLHLWAEDLSRSSFVTQAPTALPLGLRHSDYNSHLFDADMFNDIRNGTHQVYGATLLLGIRNGSYLGNYRDFLSQLPRLLIDFRQEDVDDTSSRFSPVKFRQRELAFISLNKKENWLHFRMRDYFNYLDPEDNSKETQILIGTIDHNKRREWVNFTNWLKVSADGSYTVYKQANVEIPDRTYSYNLFTVGRRQGRQLSILSNYQRILDARGIEKSFDVPVLAAFDLDRDTRLTMRLLLNGTENSPMVDSLNPPSVGADSTSRYDLFYEVRAEMNRTGSLLYKPRLQMERAIDRASDSNAVKIGAEVSTNKLAHANSWLVGFDVATVQTDNETGGESFSQLDLYGRFDRDTRRNWRYGVESAVSYGTGDAAAGGDGLRITFISNGTSLGNYDPLDVDYSGEVLLSRFVLYGEHRAEQWSNRFEVEHEQRTQDEKSEERIRLEHTLQHEARQSFFEWRSSVELGDKIVGNGYKGDYVEVAMLDSTSDIVWNSGLSYTLTPSRQLKMSYRGEVSGSSDEIYYQLTQELAYNLYTRNGRVRRLASFEEEFRYEELVKGEGFSGRTAASRLKLSAGFYPTHNYYLLGTTEYILLQPSAAAIYILTANTGFNFEKFKINLSYAFGNKGEESAVLPDVMEQRWAVDVKKSF